MAPKNKPDLNTMFLYVCLAKTGENIDFNAVAEATNLNPPAARMRYYRLKKVLDPQIVDGKVDLTKGAGGDGDGGASEASPTPSPKKPRVTKRKKAAEEATATTEGGEGEE
ncbi:hypothetical protein BDV59DRAFT_26086 [Aspergillus ambiguus]|uniref:uncharacterized protein n=1 Tax=Aspergillus ambiguus TaxID=176160 RepID=UPI003CCDE810